MSRILPSQAVSAICALFPDLLKPREPAEPSPSIPYARARDVSAALAVLAEVPSELLQLTGSELAELVIARAKANVFAQACARPFEGGFHSSSGQTMSGDVMLTILDLLKRCPDQAVPASTAGLLFVTDAVLRESLRVDIAEVNRAITDGEWKSATVVCGSVIEALLLWALNQDAPAAMASAAKLKTSGNVRTVKPTLEEWDLHQYIEVAADLGLVRPDDTVQQLRLAKDFRNLIHPGRSVRLARVCDQPTALAAAAGLGFLIRDLTTSA
jgi:hypothetical protein